MEPLFDHEKLDVYCVELQFTTWIADFLRYVIQTSAPHRRELIEQLDRASLSVLPNTAEGNSKRHGRHRAKFFDDARGSAFEYAACLDASVAKRFVSADRIRPGKEMLARVVSQRAFNQQRSEIESENDNEHGRQRISLCSLNLGQTGTICLLLFLQGSAGPLRIPQSLSISPHSSEGTRLMSEET